MIGTTGLLTRESLVLGYLGEALERYQHRPRQPRDSAFDRPEAFREACCHAENPIAFVGVFDTVGALGVPTVLHADHQFHDIHLGPAVRVARQALAIDERRRTFAPCLWSVPDDSPSTVQVVQADETVRAVPRVKQVWFQGVHSDVGGGYTRSGLSDTTLLWMTEQAKECGLVFDESLMGRFLNSGRPATPHSSMNRLYWFANALETVRPRPEVMRGTFVHGERNLTPTPVPEKPTAAQPKPSPMSIPVRLASTARATFDPSDGGRRKNLRTYLYAHTPPVPDGDEEDVVALPRPAHEVQDEVGAAAPEAAQA